MTISALSKEGPYFTSGQISFSSIRSTFKPTDTNENISISQYKRNTDYSKVPIVPDATENSGISTSTNLSLSQYRNSIKSLTLTQTGTDTELRVDALNWNGNISRNIPKNFYVNGTVGSTTSSPALLVGPSSGSPTTAFNIKIYVNGVIYGKGGDGGAGGLSGDTNGGSKPGSNGSNGSAAIYVNNVVPPISFDIIDGIAYQNYPIEVNIADTARVYGGGAGGSGGTGGANGPVGQCSYYSYFWTAIRCTRTPPSCGTATFFFSQSVGTCSRRRRRLRSRCGNLFLYEVRGGFGGAGGAGGTGRGYLTESLSLDGSIGSAGESPFCNAYEINDGIATGTLGGAGSFGETGFSGAAGGEWGTSTDSATGGSSISSVFEEGILLTGANTSETVKGPLTNVFFQ